MKMIKVESCGDCPLILYNHPCPYGDKNINLCGENTGIRIADKSLNKIHRKLALKGEISEWCGLEDYKNE